jgi:hypothetical protein
MKHYYTVTFEGTGKYHSQADIEVLGNESMTCFASDKERLNERIEERKEEVRVKFEKVLLLNNFIKNIREYGYSIRLAIKEVMEQGYKVGFHYNLMGCATIERINGKSFTIEDICNRKHYLKDEYMNSIMMSQWFITEE